MALLALLAVGDLIDLGYLGLARVDFFILLGPTFFMTFFTAFLTASGFLTALVIFVALVFLGFFFVLTFVALVVVVVAFSFLAISDSLYEALILISFPLTVEFFNWRTKIFF